MNWKCMFGFHKWTLWELVVMTRTLMSSPNQPIEFHKQHRRCEVCGLRDYKEL